VIAATCSASAATSELNQNVAYFWQARPLKELNFPNGLNDSYITRVDVAHLGFRNGRGHITETNGLYVTAYYKNGEPVIIGYVEGGFDPELSALDLDGEGKKEVLLKYHVGAHTSGYKIYKIFDDGATEIQSIDSDEITSNLDSIKINYDVNKHRYEFIVNNYTQLPLSEAPPPNEKYKLVTETYAFINGKIVVISKISNIRSYPG